MDLSISDLIKSLTEDEKKYFDKYLDNTPVFIQSEKDSYLTITPLFKVTVAQNMKYTTTPRNKTTYIIPKNSSNELKNVIEHLNNPLIEPSTYHILLILKQIYSRRISQKNDSKDPYTGYTMTAGSVINCKFCNSTKVTIENKAKRSADEPTDTFYKCHDCGREFYPKLNLRVNDAKSS